ncbi:hypothetical protein Nepgr_025562 [Nepenthes gracilis]|uniref:Bifunctional inhibitor/plant lipid transfer protein/seed storage helical domain-containing protein n=1 Tax=Nepenthes gracilis TaxID=150966 RepID=A0AAD3T739_NEPGR|nr:hypothetical protein Nepgr_025562 [Nepenthes gracilis]
MAMKMGVLFLVLMCVWALGDGNVAEAASTTDCSSLVMDMADCLSFVTNGSTDTKPTGSCCSGLKTVLKTDAECLCETFKSSGQLGFALNVTKALSLPSACHVKTPSFSKCGLTLVSSTGAPVVSPAGAPSSSIANAPSEGSKAPTPSLGNSGSSTLRVSVGSVIAALIMAVSGCMLLDAVPF